MIAPIYYQVNGEIIFNEMLARYREFTTGKPIEFICHDQENDLLDWRQEPPETLDQLMIQHAYNLRNKYERIVMSWSGGTDSHTVYNIFVQNNIHIDEIIVMHDDQFETFHDKSNVTWLINNHPDPLTKITPLNRFDLDSKSLTVDSEDWIMQNRSTMFKIGLGYPDLSIERYLQKQYPDQRYGLVFGMDPDLL